ncbi:hypothetical protein AX774_g2176 [Zancudomyces culisetae]|uniref:Uncharacterized protein n=1 Tax=Zancudomyces culisetae TaxID=1213189 RepID=A0A1R1PTM3_ZANCU|nr:hypothetical protein AX774_g2176 [Zancudomyces culisetae]|eukprot:OMH84301.1 hypothetical protein AX774_g2176 [Zancudomyces culisetae]
MSEYTGVKRKKLTFKGEQKKTKKKVYKAQHVENQLPEITEGWVPVESIEDLEGPIIILSRSTSTKIFTVLTGSGGYTETGQILRDVNYIDLVPFSPTFENGNEIYEPKSADQVFVGQRIVLKGTEEKINSDLPNEGDSGMDNLKKNNPTKSMLVLKTSKGGYLSFNHMNQITAETVAIGPSEMWEPVIHGDTSIPGTVSFMADTTHLNPQNKAHGSLSLEPNYRFLSVIEKDATKPTTHERKSKGGPTSSICISATKPGSSETFSVYCQARIRYERIKAKSITKESTKTGDLAAVEEEIA